MVMNVTEIFCNIKFRRNVGNMSRTKKDIQEYEEKYKKILYKYIENIMASMYDALSSNRRISKRLDLNLDIDMPNIGVTINNKINEISHEFEDAGISMFAMPNEENEFVGSNFVGDAILDDLFAKFGKGSQAYTDYVSNLEEAINRRNERAKALVKTSPIKKFFSKIRSFFARENIKDYMSFLPEEIEKMSSNITKYKNIDEEIWSYSLKDNVAQSIINSITSKGYDKETMQYMLEEEVMPTIKSLGLESIESQIETGLSEYENQAQDLNNGPWRLTQSQRIDLQIKAQKLAENLRNDNRLDKTVEQEKEY